MFIRDHCPRRLSLRALLKTESMNPAYRPMLATLVDEPFDDKRWVFETKWDDWSHNSLCENDLKIPESFLLRADAVIE
jgi:hypothetical protein